VGHVAVAQGQTPSIFIGDVAMMNILIYIYRLHATDKYIIIFLRTEEYKELYLSALYSSAILSVNREI
jgi:hypothetical protein